MSKVADYDKNVFVNCPFDAQYRPTFDAIIFAVHDAGFRARCALEFGDSSENRYSKIIQIIRECRYGIHDLSRVELSKVGRKYLPRFNMPLELGIFLGSKEFGDKRQKSKSCMVVDREPWRYQATISDMAGQDIYCHDGKPHGAIREICKWLTTISPSTIIPGGTLVSKRFRLFQKQLPSLCEEMKKSRADIVFVDYSRIVAEWLKFNTL
jgi:hypothetical protein